ncbi:MAG: hypothetical protein KDA96_20310, partial [Planctomycetaceae bacterium]|nr:hypothetical protein [Planctomycetaceae bacterium]
MVSRLSTTPDITDAVIRAGLQNTWWPLRFEIQRRKNAPSVILDAAHNVDSAHALTATLRESGYQPDNLTLIFAASADKDVQGMLQTFLPFFSTVILTRFVGNPRSVPPDQLSELASHSGNARDCRILIAQDPTTALALADRQTPEGGTICATGSLFLASEVRRLLTPDSPFSTEDK